MNLQDCKQGSEHAIKQAHKHRMQVGYLSGKLASVQAIKPVCNQYDKEQACMRMKRQLRARQTPSIQASTQACNQADVQSSTQACKQGFANNQASKEAGMHTRRHIRMQAGRQAIWNAIKLLNKQPCERAKN